jgi:hypothetical protein
MLSLKNMAKKYVLTFQLSFSREFLKLDELQMPHQTFYSRGVLLGKYH